jgi:hypothetical protein
MGHSQGGSYPLEATLVNAAGIKGLILVELGSCSATYSDQQIATLAAIPILVVFGDHLDALTGIPVLAMIRCADSGLVAARTARGPLRQC